MTHHRLKSREICNATIIFKLLFLNIIFKSLPFHWKMTAWYLIISSFILSEMASEDTQWAIHFLLSGGKKRYFEKFPFTFMFTFLQCKCTLFVFIHYVQVINNFLKITMFLLKKKYTIWLAWLWSKYQWFAWDNVRAKWISTQQKVGIIDLKVII